MRRRQFIGLIGGAAVSPLVARAQQAPPQTIGFLGSTVPDERRQAAFRSGLAEHGLVEGRDVAIAFAWANSQWDRLPALIADLDRRRVAVIFAAGNQAALAIRTAKLAIPFVFSIGDDPVRLGLVASFNSPAVNGTGVTFYSVALAGKRLGILDELVAKGAPIAMLASPASPNYSAQRSEVEASARSIGRQIEFFNASTVADLEQAFASIVERRIGGFFYSTDPFFNAQRRRLVAFAREHRLLAVYSGREYTEEGGLIAYGASIRDAHRQAGSYIGRILKGEKAADLPVVQPTTFELILNLRTARELGIEFPARLLALADEVIE